MTKFRAVLAELVRGRVEFVVIGGVAAVLRGAPVMTFDLDIVPARDAANAERLQRALAALNARYRGHRDVEPTAEDLQRPGHHLLLTRAGPIDVLWLAVGERDFEKLSACSDSLPLREGLEARALRLEEILAMKEQLGREKDLAALPILRTDLRLSRSSESEPPRAA